MYNEEKVICLENPLSERERIIFYCMTIWKALRYIVFLKEK